MVELLRDILGSVGGSFAVVTSFIIVSAWGIMALTRKITQHEDMVKYSSRSVGALEDKVHLILKDLAYIKGTLQVMQSGAPTLIQSHSPIFLTELGRKKAEEMGVADMIAQDWERIETAVENDKAALREELHSATDKYWKLQEDYRHLAECLAGSRNTYTIGCNNGSAESKVNL